ncbi:MAG: type II toxin-antitoxin system RelE/ParE family toxin [Deltaproteobacteria bacterium]|nr:type II toxin-antitoxin system RelE/ParE family toxin [Deltaproteobacteria bacterium]
MNRYRIFETTIFQEDLEGIPNPFRSKVIDKLRNYVYPQLRQQPHFGLNIKKLKNWSPETWRYRIGPWRFFYEIDEKQKVVSMTTLDQRKDAYG